MVFEKNLVDEKFLATTNGKYNGGASNGEATYGQICLADSKARAWVVERLFEFLDAVHPDYVKWDNNFWMNCNRASHGHGLDDGNFQHYMALNTILAELRDRYPSMDVENSAGGGNRLSLGMLGYTDAGWMDDHSAPSIHVRHNIGGLSAMFLRPICSRSPWGCDEFVDARKWTCR